MVLPGTPERRLYPLAFCRECGQEYLLATRPTTWTAWGTWRPGTACPGWSTRTGGPTATCTCRMQTRGRATRWLSHGCPRRGRWTPPLGRRWSTTRRKNLPVRVLVGPDGRLAEETATAEGTLGAWIPGDFKFCLSCGVSYESIRSAELAKLATLDKEGRSSAMTVLASSIVTSLADLRRVRVGPRGPQAADVRGQPAGRLPAGRAPQRLRAGRPAPGGDLPRGAGRGPRVRSRDGRLRVRDLQDARAPARRTTRRPPIPSTSATRRRRCAGCWSTGL